jgi:hypothetical protein
VVDKKRIIGKNGEPRRKRTQGVSESLRKNDTFRLLCLATPIPTPHPTQKCNLLKNLAIMNKIMMV